MSRTFEWRERIRPPCSSCLTGLLNKIYWHTFLMHIPQIRPYFFLLDLDVNKMHLVRLFFLWIQSSCYGMERSYAIETSQLEVQRLLRMLNMNYDEDNSGLYQYLLLIDLN